MPRSKMILLIVLGAVFSVVADTCNHDNCYRGFNRAAYTNDAQSFCSSFTLSAVVATAGLPIRASACSGVARISSVCSCAYPAPLIPTSSVKKVSSPTSSSITPLISNKSPTTLLTTTSIHVIAPYIPKWASIPGCNGDNCMNAFDGHNGSAFCSLFALGGTLAPSFPTYATMCGSATSSRVSSACSCLNYVSSSPLSSTMESPVIISSHAPVSPSNSPDASSLIVQPIIPGLGAVVTSVISIPTSTPLAAPNPLPSSIPIAAIDTVTLIIESVGSPVFASSTAASPLISSTSALIIPEPSSSPTAAPPASILTTILPDRIPVQMSNLDFTIPSAISTSAIIQLSPFTSINILPSPILSATTLILASPSAITSASISGSAPVVCNEDNCLRAMQREGGDGATAFCASFTVAVVTDIAALPTYASMCFADAVSQISSACSCLTPSLSFPLPTTTAVEVIHVPMEPIPVAPARTTRAAARDATSTW